MTLRDEKQPLDLLRSAAMDMMTAAFAFDSGDLKDQRQYADYRLVLSDTTPYEVENLIQVYRDHETGTFIFRNVFLRWDEVYILIFEQNIPMALVALRTEYILAAMRVDEQSTEG